MAQIDLSTAGITLQYAAEETAGVRPTSGYAAIPGITSIPDMNPEPATHQTTDLSATEWHTYIPALKDPGGALAYGANLNQASFNKWQEICDLAETLKAAGKRLWITAVIPGLTHSFYMAIEPTPLGQPAIAVDEVLTTDIYMTPTQVDGWQLKPAA